MRLIQILLISISLAMDAFAIAICKGLSLKNKTTRNAIIIAFWFGIFQALMTILGYLIGSSFENLIRKIDYLIAFILLVFVGLNMIKDAFSESKIDNDLGFKTMFILAIATSIDALTVGITFAFFKNSIILNSNIIGLITFILSFIGAYFGSILGNKYKRKAQLFGGITLICIGLKMIIF